jgi:surfeit locus 1 family protein
MALIAVAVVAFISLGRWQWERGVARSVQWADFDAAGPALPAGTRDLDALPRFARVELIGRYDAARQFLLDNRSHAGRPGYEVLTPLLLEDGRAILVNRGWVPFSGYRDRVPRVRFEAAGSMTVSGRLGELPVAGLPSGRRGPERTDAWPKVASFPTLAQLEAALGRKLERRILLLDEDAPHGYTREWRPPGVPPGRHFSYAVQWWAFAALAVVLWLVMSLKKEHG